MLVRQGHLSVVKDLRGDGQDRSACVVVDDRRSEADDFFALAELVHEQGVHRGEVDEEVITAGQDEDGEHFGEVHREGTEAFDDGSADGPGLRPVCHFWRLAGGLVSAENEPAVAEIGDHFYGPA